MPPTCVCRERTLGGIEMLTWISNNVFLMFALVFILVGVCSLYSCLHFGKIKFWQKMRRISYILASFWLGFLCFFLHVCTHPIPLLIRIIVIFLVLFFTALTAFSFYMTRELRKLEDDDCYDGT